MSDEITLGRPKFRLEAVKQADGTEMFILSRPSGIHHAVTFDEKRDGWVISVITDAGELSEVTFVPVKTSGWH